MYYADGILLGILIGIGLMCFIATTFGWVWFVKIINDFKNLSIAESNKNTDL